MNVVAAKAMEQMTNEASYYILHELDASKHTEEQVKAIIDVFPELLSIEDVGEKSSFHLPDLPVQNAALEPHKVSFIPLMAK